MTENKHFEKLVPLAKSAFDKAYAPYSRFHVGAALVTKEGEFYKGCNVENASYGLTVCAERNCISAAVVDGAKDVECLVVYTEQEQLTPPCGACRQVIAEFLTEEGQVISVNHLNQSMAWNLEQLLPAAFTPKMLK